MVACGSTVAGQWSTVDGRGSWIAGCGSRGAVPSLGRQTLVKRNVCYADVRAVWHVFHVASGIQTTTVSDAWPHVDRHGLSKIGGSPVRVNWKTTHSVARSLAHVQGAFRACERCDFFVRARRDLSRTNMKFGTAFRFSGATLHRAERLFVAQTFGLFCVISGSRVDGRVRRTSKACELRFCGRGWRGAALLYRRVAAVIRC